MGEASFAQIRSAAESVTRRARSVRIDPEGLERFVGLLEEDTESLHHPVEPDPAHHYRGSHADTVAFIITLDAVNFGSGWFPHLHKRPGCSGYFTIATCLTERFDRRGPFSAPELVALDAADCAALFEQDLAVPEQAELIGLFAEALGDLGRLLESQYGGRFEALVEAAGGRAARLVGLLEAMPFYRDVARYGDLVVPFYKRAQITAADLAAAFGGEGPGRFDDLDDLTIFADNLVPHVLRREGVLRADPELARRIDAEKLLDWGSPEEVELRAVALHAVERMVEALAKRGVETNAGRLDSWLWNRGQRPEIKAHPRHRCRSVYY